jgi:hypothetical protein
MSNESEWLSPTEFLARHQGRFGRNSLYDWLAEGKLPHLKINRKILIPADAFDRMLAEQVGQN